MSFSTRYLVMNEGSAGLAFGNGIFVIALEHGRIMTSTDAVTWTEYSGPSAQKIEFANDRFIVPGSFTYSTDGINWSNGTGGEGLHTMECIAYGNNIYVSIDDNYRAKLSTSTDGVNWTSRNTIQDQTYHISYIYDVTFGNGTFVAVGPNGIAYSTNGINWTYSSNAPVSNYVSVAYGNNIFIAFSSSSGSSQYSSDGINWTNTTLPTNVTRGIFAEDRFIVIYDTNFLTSTDGINWTTITNNQLNYPQRIAFGNSKYVLAGFHDTSAMGNTFITTYPGFLPSYDNVPEISVGSDPNQIESTSISTQDLTDPTVVGTTVVEKRTFSKNAVLNMFDANTNAIAGKRLVLKAGSALPGFSDSIEKDTILVDGRTPVALNKSEMLDQPYYIPMAVGSTVTAASLNDTVIITQTDDTTFTLAYLAGTVTKSSGDSFLYDGLSILLGSVNLLLQSFVICFKEGTKITCLSEETQEEVDIPIEKMTKDTFVKTYKHGFVKVKAIAHKTIENTDGDERIRNRLYVCDPGHFEELKEPLIMTGCHALLVDEITSNQRSKMTEELGEIFITDDKYRLMCMYDEHIKPYKAKGEFTVWHVCLEHYDVEMNYGIYANGLLVESCPECNIHKSGYDVL